MIQNLVTVIIPVYNVADYLSSCIDSVITQTYGKIEVILIDDGSTDQSGKICDVYALQDSRIKVLHVENGGVSKARNLALRQAQGEWITFVDSDDLIPQGVFQLYVDCAKNNNLQMVMGHIRFDSNTDGSEYHIPRQSTGVYYKENSEKYIRESLTNWKWSSWGKLFHRSLFDNVFFPDGIPSYEDYTVLWDVALKMPSYAIISEVCYIARYRPGSASRLRDGITTYQKRVKSLCYVSERMSVLFLNYPSIRRSISKFVITEGVACRDLYGKFDNEDKNEVISQTNFLWESMNQYCILPWYMRILLAMRVKCVKMNINNYPLWQYAPIRIAMRFL